MGFALDRWNLDLRWNNGTKIINGDTEADRDIKDRTLSLTLGYALDISDL